MRSLAILGLLLTPFVEAATIEAGAKAAARTIQEAIDACPKADCEVVLLDTAYDLPREVWIEGKTGLSIHPSAALVAAGIRPHLKFATGIDPRSLPGTAANPADPQRPAGWMRWPRDSDRTSSTCAELGTCVAHASTGYLEAAMIAIHRSSDIRLEGLKLDGGTPKTEIHREVFSRGFDLVWGNTGISLFQSLRTTVRDCDISGFFNGLVSYGRIANGHLARVYPVDGIGYASPSPGEPTEAGDHLVEANRLHDNIWAIRSQSEWDEGSTFRFNLAWNNRNDGYANLLRQSSFAPVHTGGFLLVEDVPLAVHSIHNNTIHGSPSVVAYTGYNGGVQHLFNNNIVAGSNRIGDPALRATMSDSRQLLFNGWSEWLDHTLFEIGADDTLYRIKTVSSGEVDDSEVCVDQHASSRPCFANFSTPFPMVKTGINSKQGGWPPLIVLRGGATYTARVGGKTILLDDSSAIEIVPGGGIVEKIPGMRIPAQSIRWATRIPWKSTSPSSPDFLVPAWDSALVGQMVAAQGREASGWSQPTTGFPPDLGAKQKMSSLPQVFSFRRQQWIVPNSDNCVPVRMARQNTSDEVYDLKISSIEAWSIPDEAYRQGTNPESHLKIYSTRPEPLAVHPLPDSGLSSDQTISVCLDSIPSFSLRLQLEATGTLRSSGAMVTSQPVVFEWLAPTLGPSSVHRTRPSPLLPIDKFLPGRIEIVLGVSGPCEYQFRRLDGTLMGGGTLLPVQGRISVPLPEARNLGILRIRSGVRTWQRTIPVL